MPEKETIRRAKADKRQGKSTSTQAGEFVREEMHHIREGKHGARSPEQAIAIGLSKARRSGVKLQPPEKGEAPKETRERAKSDLKRGAKSRKKPAAKRARASKKALKGEGRGAASKKALASHARKAAKRRTASERSASAKKAARTRAKRK